MDRYIIFVVDYGGIADAVLSLQQLVPILRAYPAFALVLIIFSGIFSAAAFTAF